MPPPFCDTMPGIPSGESALSGGRLGNLYPGEDDIIPPGIGAGDDFGDAAGPVDLLTCDTTLIAHFCPFRHAEFVLLLNEK